jgi:CRISP-associated protein Cas1
MQLTKTKTDVILDETIEKILVHANFIRLYLDDKEILADIPVEQINSIMVYGSKINIPGRLIKLCNEYQIPFHLLTDYHKHNGSIYFSIHNNIINRLNQFQALVNEKWRVFLSKQILIQKLKTQLIPIQTWSSNPDFQVYFNKLLKKIEKGEKLSSLMGYEGNAASLYWQLFGKQLNEEINWIGRVKNPCLDPINSLLSLGYALLATQCQTSLTLNGLDPYLGILHKTNEDRPALVYDLMEIYRVLIVDLWVLELFNQKVFEPDDFVFTAKGVCTLRSDKKNEFFKMWYKRLKYYKFSTNKGKITIHDFLQINTTLLIKWFKKINKNKVRDTGRYDRFEESLLIFKNYEEFKII